MGFFYRDKDGNRTVGYTFTFKFGGSNHKTEDAVASFADKFVTLLERFGVEFERDSDNDPNKDRRLF